MKNRWLSFVTVVLVAFAYLVTAVQFFDFDRAKYDSLAIPQMCMQQYQLSMATNILQRDQNCIPLSAMGRNLDLMLPKDARVYMEGMTGFTNMGKGGLFFFMTYYLFPRDVCVSLDTPARQTKEGFLGREATSDQELVSNGFDVAVGTAGGGLSPRMLRPLSMGTPDNPDWFTTGSDAFVAFLLPLLTAIAGMGLLRLVFPGLSARLRPLERLACGLGLGMMMVAALTLGLKLCGFHGHYLVFLLAIVGSVWEIWTHREEWRTTTVDGLKKAVRSPVLMLGVLVFLLMFRLAGLQGILEFDAVPGWAMKAKIIHLSTGGDVVKWFSNPRLSHSHLDYPTLVPSLHAATYDSIGHVNEFVTKFWPAWMLLLLVGSLGSLRRSQPGWFNAPAFLLLALALLPATQKYAHYEGGTMPMVFFTVMGIVQCATWIVEKDRARLALGLVLLFGGAMAKFEGAIFLSITTMWILLLPSARPGLKITPRVWRLVAFCALAAIPFAILRVQIPSLHYENGWLKFGLQNLGHTLSTWPGVFMMMISRLFVDPGFAEWSGEGEVLTWKGHWEGFSSLFNHPTLGVAWLALFMTVVLWFALPERRKVLVWMLAVIITTLGAFSFVFSCFSNVFNLQQVIAYTSDIVANRYLFPILLSWVATMMVMLFCEFGNHPATQGDGKG